MEEERRRKEGERQRETETEKDQEEEGEDGDECGEEEAGKRDGDGVRGSEGGIRVGRS